jgi:dTDP-4-amino-4,6-dideoxygalactose transaminase
MKPQIQMLDLSAQHRRIQREIDEAIRSVIETSQFINGTAVDEFARDLAIYTGAQQVIPCGNGTDALQISLMAADLRAGDEVLIPAFSYVAAAEAASLLGLVPVWVDVNADTCNMNVEKIEAAITSRTRAIIPVHLFGQAAEMETILQIAAKHHLFVIEDAAQSIGASCSFSTGEKKQCGTMGDTGCLSFFPSKNLACFGDGGAILTNDSKLAARLKMIASHGQSVKYRHEIIGCNSRLDTLQAAILRVKLRYLNDYNAARRQVAACYRQGLRAYSDFLTLPVEKAHTTHVYHQFTIQVKNGKRDALKACLQEKGIPSMIYYPLSLPEQPVYANANTNTSAAAQAVVAKELAASVLSLPIHTEMDDEQLYYIITQIQTFFN